MRFDPCKSFRPKSPTPQLFYFIFWPHVKASVQIPDPPIDIFLKFVLNFFTWFSIAVWPCKNPAQIPTPNWHFFFWFFLTHVKVSVQISYPQLRFDSCKSIHLNPLSPNWHFFENLLIFIGGKEPVPCSPPVSR